MNTSDSGVLCSFEVRSCINSDRRMRTGSASAEGRLSFSE
jgi:hypothetical protein